MIYPPLELEHKEMGMDIYEMRELYPDIQDMLDKYGVPGVVVPIKKKCASGFFEGIAYLVGEMEIENIPRTHKLLRQAVICYLENSMLRYTLFPRLYPGMNWQDFIHEKQASNKGLDENWLLISAAANYLERNVLLVHRLGKQNFGGGNRADLKPPLILALYKGEYWPVFQYQKMDHYVGDSLCVVKYDMKYSDKHKVYSELQEFVNSRRRKDSRLSARVIGYMSKVISEDDRGSSIWKKDYGFDQWSAQI